MYHHHLVTVLWTSGIDTLKEIKQKKEYVVKFDEFLMRCSTFSKKGQTQILSRFVAGLREDVRTELLARRVTELEKAYTIVHDLDSLRFNYNTRSFDSKSSMSGLPHLPSSVSLTPNPPLERMTS